jgi:tRNA pseudouridine55 synthase
MMMARRRKGSPVHGWVVLDKPKGMTSTHAVARVRGLFDANKAGHAGTLDPLATGVLAVALGEATKTIPFAVDGPKQYRFVARWGEGRDTDDADGKPVAFSEVRPSQEQILGILPRFTGNLMQVPPVYSAIKVAGERAYDLAREGAPAELMPRPISIYAAGLIERPDLDHAVFEVECGKGSYIRAWVRDIALALGTYGHVTELRRLRAGPFSLGAAISLERLEGFRHSPAALECLRPIATALDGIPALAVTDPDSVRLRSGNSILIRAPLYARLMEQQAGSEPAGRIEGQTVYLSTAKGEPVALAEFAEGELRPFRVFNFGPGSP